MLEASAVLIVNRLDARAQVLDVGGGLRPFARADWVLDALPYEHRGELGWTGDPSTERFGRDSWVQRDMCDREPWPFADRQFEFAVCSHTLEDVRDPVWVASELQRVAKAGYIEVPSLLQELTYGVQGPWVGWGHHRWLVLVGEGEIDLLFKHHVVNRKGSHLPAGATAELSDEELVQTFWWEGGFGVRERFLWTAEQLDGFLEGFVKDHRPRSRPRVLRRLGKRAGRSR